MSHDPVAKKVLSFERKNRPQTLAEGLLIPPPPESTAGDSLPTRRQRLHRSQDFTRIWPAWFKELRWRRVFPPTARLWSIIWYRSHEGTEPVTLTQEIADQAVVSRRRCYLYVRRLENLQLVRVERIGQSSLTVIPLVRPHVLPRAPNQDAPCTK